MGFLKNPARGLKASSKAKANPAIKVQKPGKPATKKATVITAANNGTSVINSNKTTTNVNNIQPQHQSLFTLHTAKPPMPSNLPWWISDITFVVEGQKIAAHKVILCSRSKYFAQYFESHPSETEIQITRFSHNVFSRFIQWVYTSNNTEVPMEAANDLLGCAKEYQVLELQTLCEKTLQTATVPAPTTAEITAETSPTATSDLVSSPLTPGSIDLDFDTANVIINGDFDNSMNTNNNNIDVLPMDADSGNKEASLLMGTPEVGLNNWSCDPILYQVTGATGAMHVC